MMPLAYEPRTLAEMHARKREADRRQADRAAQHRREAAAKARADLTREVEALRPQMLAQAESAIVAPSSRKGTLPRSRQIIRAIAGHYGVSVAEINGQRRTARIVRARQRIMVALYLECPDISMPAIGRAIGGKDHSTVWHACQKFGAWPGRVWPAELSELRGLVAAALDPSSANGWHGEGCA